LVPGKFHFPQVLGPAVSATRPFEEPLD
jgi:hypothetical protein